jgi:hypothetical protein
VLGSEGAKAALSKDQQAEARDINRSLLTLGKVVFELAKGSQGGHVPFRDSLLTRLLKVGEATRVLHLAAWHIDWFVGSRVPAYKYAKMAVIRCSSVCSVLVCGHFCWAAAHARYGVLGHVLYAAVPDWQRCQGGHHLQRDAGIQPERGDVEHAALCRRCQAHQGAAWSCG